MPNIGEDMEELKLFIQCYIGMQNVLTFFFLNVNPYLPYDLGILPPGIYTRDMKAHVHEKTCMQKCIATLFITIPNWKQPKYPSEKINKF